MAIANANSHHVEPAPLALAFGAAAFVIVRVLRHRPEIGARILLGPRRDVHLRAAAALHLYQCRTEVHHIADILADEHPRAALHRVFGQDVDPHLRRLLDRAALPAWPLGDYRRLNDLLRNGLHDALPSGEFTRADVRRLHDLLEGDPVLRRARHAVPDAASMKALADMLSVLRRMGASAALDGLPDKAGRKAVLRRLHADLGALRSPHREFPAPPGWNVIGRVADLWTLGQTLDLCFAPRRGHSTASHTLALITGTSVFLHKPDVAIVAELVRSFDGSFHVAEMRGARNTGPPEGCLHDLREGLAAAGIPMTNAGFEGALRGLLCTLDRLVADLEAAEDPAP